MKNILVPIDFSTNSRKAIRFAIQVASQTQAKITFYHMVNIIVPISDTVWDYTYYTQFQEEERQFKRGQLEKLIETVYNHKLPSGVKYDCVCNLGNDVGEHIYFYAKKHDFDCICVGARGTGVVAKLFGTVASYLILHSSIPVFVIPKNYRLKPLSVICYASDMENPKTEIQKVVELAKSLKAKLEVLHFDYEKGLLDNQKKLSEIAETYESKDVKFYFKKLDALYPLHDHLKKAMEQFKPSLVALFTKENHNWYDRLFLSSESAELSFTSKTPLLVFRKTNN